MIIDKKTIDFFKTAKTVCDVKTAEVNGVFYNGEKFIAASRQFQVVFFTGEPKTTPIVLPIIALDYISAFPKGSRVDFELENDKIVKVKCGRSRASFPLLTYSLPKTAKEDVSTEIELNTSVIKALKIACSAADSNTNVSPKMQGVVIKKVDSELVAFSTNGIRLSYVRLSDCDKEFHAKVQKDMLSKVISSGLFSEEETFTMSISDDSRKLIFKTSQTYIVCPMFDFSEIEAKSFIEKVKSSSKTISFEKEAIISLLRRASILAKNSVLVLTIKGRNAEIKINESTSEFCDSIDIEGSSQENEISIGFAIGLLFEAVNNIEADTIRMVFSGSNSPVYFTDEEEKTRCLVMPMRINSISES